MWRFGRRIAKRIEDKRLLNACFAYVTQTYKGVAEALGDSLMPKNISSMSARLKCRGCGSDGAHLARVKPRGNITRWNRIGVASNSPRPRSFMFHYRILRLLFSEYKLYTICGAIILRTSIACTYR
jgi:hypothetical protein